MKLIVISSPDPVAEEPQRINQLFAAGLEYFHLRKPHYPRERLRQLLSQIEQVHYHKIALHHHHDLAGEFRINRLHYTEKIRSLTQSEKWLKLQFEGYRLSTSVHTVEVLRSLPSCFAYTFFGPVFNSISKSGYQAVSVDPALIEATKTVPVIALGGINADNVLEIPKMKFDGTALLGSIWGSPEQSLTSFIKIKEKCQKAAHTY
jgi:thiamine-phosphate pyrophosphorylase